MFLLEHCDREPRNKNIYGISVSEYFCRFNKEAAWWQIVPD